MPDTTNYLYQPNQPINFNKCDFNADPCNIGDAKEYCTLVEIGDTIQWQRRLIPSDAFPYGEMAGEIYGTSSELLSNTGFTGSAASWTLGAGWTYGSNKITHTPGSANVVSQTFSGAPGYPFVVYLTISGATAGGVYITEAGGSTVTATTSGNGDFVLTLIASPGGGDFNIVPTSDFDGAVDYCSARNVAIAYAVVGSFVGWEYSLNGTEGSFIHSTGNVDPLQWLYGSLTAGDYVEVSVSVRNRTAGSIGVSVYGTAATVFGENDTNGILKFYGTVGGNPGDGTQIIPTSDFDGEVYALTVKELTGGDEYVYICDDDETNCTELSSSGTDELIYSRSGPFELFALEVPEAYGGCKTLLQSNNIDGGDDTCICLAVETEHDCTKLIEASCDLDTVKLGFFWGASYEFEDLFTDTSFADPGEWSIANSGAGTGAVVSGGALTLSSASGGFNFWTVYQLFAWPHGKAFTLNYSFQTGDVDAAVNNVYFQDQAGNSHLMVSNIQPSTSYSGSLTIPATSYPGAYVNQARIIVTANSFTGDIVFNSMSLSAGLTGTEFKLSQRLRFLKFNPTYPIEANDYEYSNGIRSLTYGKREKYYEGLIDYIGETELDTLSAQILCDTFTIDGERYFVRPEDVKPEWDKDGRQRLAQVRLILRKYDSTISTN